jgi:hypothetical protein
VARLTANVTPTLLNEFVASYTSDHIFLTALNNPALPAGLPIGALFANGFGGKLPSVDLKGNNAYGGEFGQDTGYFPWNDANPTYTYRDNVTKFLGITPSSSAPISPRDQRTRRTPPTFRAF